MELAYNNTVGCLPIPVEKIKEEVPCRLCSDAIVTAMKLNH